MRLLPGILCGTIAGIAGTSLGWPLWAIALGAALLTLAFLFARDVTSGAVEWRLRLLQNTAAVLVTGERFVFLRNEGDVQAVDVKEGVRLVVPAAGEVYMRFRGRKS